MNKYDEYADYELLEQIKGNNCAAAFSELYDRYKMPLLLYAVKKLDASDAAEDIVHDLFANVWSNRLKIEVNIKAYLYTSLRNKIIDYQLKSNNARKVLDSFSKFVAVNNPYHLETDYKVRENILVKEIDSIINNLSELDKQIIQMRMNGFKSREIATELNVHEKTIRNHSWMILKNLRSKLSAIFFFLF